MRLELGLHPDDAARLSRLAVLAPLKQGRARSRAVRIVWHDGLNGGLAEQGLIVAEQRQGWRLERLRPDAEPWPPGGPARVLAEGRAASALGQEVPDPLLPVAAFEGRALTMTLATDQGPVTLTLLNGTVRAVAAEHRASRLFLEGEELAVGTVALMLGDAVRAEVPGASLAAEALAVARGRSPPPRHHGAPELPAGLSVAAAFAHVVGHLTDVILHFAPLAAEGNDGPEPVHQMRVAVRRLRSAIKVFGPAVGCPPVDAADAGLKALASRLGPTRDWDVFVTETGAKVGAAFPDGRHLNRLLGAAERRRRACHAELRAWLQGAGFRQLGIELACLAGGEAWQAALDQDMLATPLAEFSRDVLDRRLKRLTQLEGDIETLAPAELHKIRIRAKRMRYAAEIFAPLHSGKAGKRFIRRLGALQDRLGAMNDGAVAGTLLSELGGSLAFARGVVMGFVGAHGGRTRKQIVNAWEDFHRLVPFWE
jgi:CHAD domain-containing protein